MESQPQEVDANQNGVIVVACISKLVLVRNKDVVASINLSYEATSVSISRNRNQVAVGGKVIVLNFNWFDIFQNFFRFNIIDQLRINCDQHVDRVDSCQLILRFKLVNVGVAVDFPPLCSKAGIISVLIWSKA